MKTILIDWSVIRDRDDFYDSVLPQTGAPSWHGHNLDAINDSWVTGDICSDGPPFRFVIRGIRDVSPDMEGLRDAVSELARESVKVNGGLICRED